MSLNVEGGLSRIVRGLRIVGKVWWWGGVIVLAFALGISPDLRDQSSALTVLVLGLIVAGIPAGLAFGLAWLLDGFLQPKG